VVSIIDISRKVFIITLLICAVLTAAFTLTHNMGLSNSLELERVDTLQNVGRIQNTISLQQRDLDYLVADWACWNESYRFVEDRNQRFIDETIKNETLSVLKLNVLIYVNDSGSVVYAKAVDIGTAEQQPVPKDLLKLIKDKTLLTKSKNETFRGFVLLDKDPMFISCHPILTTEYQGPVKGTLIFGRYFDKPLLDSFSNATHISLSKYRVDRDMPLDFQTKLKNFSELSDKTIIEPIDKEKVAGYFELRDTSGQPALIIRADFPRDLYLRSERTVNYIFSFLMLTGLMTGIGVKFAIDKLFISRLIGIENFVTRVRSEKDFSKRLPLKDNDELYRVSREINGMLNEIYLTEQEYRKEQELKAQERENKVLLDSLNELVVFVNPQLNIIWANRATLENMKMSLQEAVGICIKSAPGISGPLSEYLQLEQIFVTGNKKSGEFTAKDDSSWFVQAIPVTDEDGKIIGILETCRDITEKKAAEKLLQEKQIAEVANRTKSDFLANMSHELRTPLNSIIGFSDLLHEQAYGDLNEKQLRSVGNISKSGKHLLNLINDILDLSKVEAGKLELDYKEFELANKLNLIKNLLFPIADQKKIVIEIEMDNKLKDIRADEERFVQVMYNLVDNAIKFSHEKSVVKIGARKKGDLVEITVEDTGIGIKTEDENKIFKPFSQIDPFSSKTSEGTGLGLSLVKQIVHLHGGYVWFRSKAREGSTFAFTIPINVDKGNSGDAELDV